MNLSKMVKRPFFSIALPTYNRADKLKKAISYLLSQNFEDFEIVVSDNNSTDNTKEIVDSFRSSKIKYFKNKKNIDVLPNVKKVINFSKGKYIFLHSDDDFLVDNSILSEIKKIIEAQNLGYIRLNYLNITPDARHVFDFRASKGFLKDEKLEENSKPLDVINFLINSDCSFITGIIFKNEIPKNVSVIDSQLYSWFPLLYYITKKYGGFYLDKHYILAEWSTWRMRKDNFHPLFSLKNGKLTSEEYFSFVKDKLSEKQFKDFLEKTLWGIYVKNFFAVKWATGSSSMVQLASRLIHLVPEFKYRFSFWIYFTIALIFPRILLSLIRKNYLKTYANRPDLDAKYSSFLKKSD